MKIAVLSNVNLNGTIRMIKKHTEVFETEGYGNEIGILMNPSSSVYLYAPDIIFVIEDVMEQICHNLDESEARMKIEQWFLNFERTIKADIIYYVSDAYLWGQELSVVVDKGLKSRIETIWQENLEQLISRCKNVRVFPYNRIIVQEGEKNAFSLKMWYMGKILHSPSMQQRIGQEIIYITKIERRTPKKLLLLDLDNTLWGGLAGEMEFSPIELSEDHIGLAYKNLQRVILEMKKQGVLLGIVSKNNIDDVENILKNHSHMVLRDEDFVIKKINWTNKADNIRTICNELNLGLDSVVFFDDNPTERQLIMQMLPEVIVPDFPERPEDLAGVMVQIWKTHFDRPVLTEEDTKKTKQYAANVKRANAKRLAASFEEYLDGLKIKLIKKNEKNQLERITQLINKTNQFNTMTKRHSMNEMQNIIASENKIVFAYQVVDCFGDNGIVAVVVVDVSSEVAVIEEFVMSCRVMGKNIENAIIQDVEDDLAEQGYSVIEAEYSATIKNKPVKDLYLNLGYAQIQSSGEYKRYSLNMNERPRRDYKVERFAEMSLTGDMKEKSPV